MSKRWIFNYNKGMVWLRKGIVHLLALVLLVALLDMAAATAVTHDFSSPNKLEGWLAQTKIYAQIIPNALTNAQVASSQDGSEGSISLSDTGVQQAATQAFPPTLLQQSINNFLAGNYAWLKGQSAIPSFRIDLSSAKQSFANQVGQLVQTHLAAVPVCTAAQLSELQLPVDPLAVSCRPLTLDPKTEASQVTQAILSTGDFLNKPIITAANLSQNKPYYQRASKAPQIFRLVLKLPYILAGVSLVCALGILAIATTRRKGLRRVGATLLVAGVILVATKLIADTLVNKLDSKAANTFNNQLKQPYRDVLHNIVSSLVHTEFWFGVAFLALAVVIFAYLVLTRARSKQPETPKPPAAQPPAPRPAEVPRPQLAPPQSQISTDIMSRQPRPAPPRPAPTVPTLAPRKPRPPKRPRLIQ